MLGEVQLNVKYKGQSYILTAYITKEAGPCLLGRDWLKRIQLDWKQIAHTVDRFNTGQFAYTLQI